MKNFSFIRFHIKRYRSILDVSLDISDSVPIVICGENNIGKTNVLRALNLFFNYTDETQFNPREDIPHHIYFGSQGAGAKTELTGTFIKESVRTEVKMVFRDNSPVIFMINNGVVEQDEIADFVDSFAFFFIESHNVNLPVLIASVLEKDGLLPLDNKRSKQSRPLATLKQFIEQSHVAINDIEKELNECFQQLTDFDGILKGKEVKISFAEFEKLRDVVKTMTQITLYDGNDHSIALKGSGAQRAVFLSLMEYISQNSKKKVIWGVDEPEAFLQPKLQRKVAEVMARIAKEKKQPIILTTHSPHFIDLSSLSNTHLFNGTQEKRIYTRKPGITFFEMNTVNRKFSSTTEKALAIKDHLGIKSNDGWEVLPNNIIVEGEEDKRYLEILFQSMNKPVPNIIWSGGASKIGGYLQYYNSFADDLEFKPKFLCIFDNDEEGRDQAKRIRPSTLKNLETKIRFIPRFDGRVHELSSGKPGGDWEIEDFFPPDVMLEAINAVVKKEHYKKISSKQIGDRTKAAHLSKGILTYAEECCGNRNADKPTFTLDNDGRKMQICKIFCERMLGWWTTEESLFEKQKQFVNSLLLE